MTSPVKASVTGVALGEGLTEGAEVGAVPTEDTAECVVVDAGLPV